jgi:hypothetical protein
MIMMMIIIIIMGHECECVGGRRGKAQDTEGEVD